MNLFFILILYITLVYTAYIYVLIFAAWKGRFLDLRKKNLKSSVHRHLSVIIYVQDNIDTLIDLLNALEEQDYPKDKYNLNVILDSSSDKTATVAEILSNIRLCKIDNEGIPVGLYPSVFWYLNNIANKEYTNGYVILSANNLVKNNFLSRVNISFENNSISQACIASISPHSSIFSFISYLNNRFKNRIMNAGLYHTGIGSQILSSGLIFSQEFIENYPVKLSLDESEVDLTLKLLSDKVKINWAPEVVVYNRTPENMEGIGLENADNTIKSIFAFKKYFIRSLKSILKNRTLAGYLFYLTIPSPLILLLMIFAVFLFEFYSYKKVNTELLIALTNAILIPLASIISMMIIKCPKLDFIQWIASSRYTLLELVFTCKYMISHYQYKNSIKNIFYDSPISGSFHHIINISNVKQDVLVTDGTKNVPCQIEIVNKEGESQITFLFKNKKFTTLKYNTIDKAFEELNKKLASKNFTLISCYNCGYFNYSRQSFNASNGSEGHCLYGKEGKQIPLDDLVTAWNKCGCFTNIKDRDNIMENYKNSLKPQK